MKKQITVISLGPGSPELMTLQTVKALHSAGRIILRTSSHPVSSWLDEQGLSWQSLDSFYDAYDEFEEMHRAMADWLWKESVKSPLCFGVMTPQTDGAVLALKQTCPADGVLQILPGLNPLDSCFAAIPKEKELGNSFHFFPATDFLFSYPDPGISLWVTEIDSRLLAGRVKLHMEDYYDDEQEIWFFPSSVKKHVQPVKIPLYLLDSQKKYDHTVALLIPGKNYLERKKHSWQDLTQIVEKLRAPDGCPWDRIQTHASLRPYLVEEAWEAVNAIEEQNPDHLSDELGDVLFQVFIHASIAQTFEEFSLNDVVTKISNKMIQRHPHVFGNVINTANEEIVNGWERIKREETGSKTVGETLNDVSPSLPALKYSAKVYKKLAQIPAFLRDPQAIVSDIRHLSDQLMLNGEMSSVHMSRLLKACTELCFRQNQDAEILLHEEVERFRKRFQTAEKNILREEKSPENLTFQQLCVYLNSVEGEIE